MTDRDIQRDRLIELRAEAINKYQTTPFVNGNKVDFDYFLADYLLSNGVIVPKREIDEHKIQIGDVLYEDSYSYGKVFEWKVLDIWLENYISGNKTIVKCSNGTWTKEFFVADVLQFHKTKEEAETQLKEREE